MSRKIGVLALQGSVQEHIRAAEKAAENLKMSCEVLEVRTKEQLAEACALIIPGGESTVLQRLCERENIFGDIKKLRFIFGTCAGAIMLAKALHNREQNQKTLGLMDMEVDRNAYGRQISSFEKRIKTDLGSVNAVFIRAPRINRISGNIRILAKSENEVVACEQRVCGNYYLAATFHPELTTTAFHGHFLKQAMLKAL